MEAQQTMSVDQFLANTEGDWYRPHALCADGWTISIQRSHYHHSDDETVEIACTRQDALASHDEGKINADTSTKRMKAWHVYGYIPVDTVQTIVDAHGGIVGTDAQS